VGLVAGLYLVLAAPSTKSPSSTVRIAPMLGGSAAGAAIGGGF
jgi:hypothetical protein